MVFLSFKTEPKFSSAITDSYPLFAIGTYSLVVSPV
ncbi:hypothetical protein Fluta_2737 [Fluviicola taffensis DSM 16823]|uniref:Uncharacterized protein n=1 Tax=Fluviicola taffensis (strain DSM 16823 / NCIMB 13979 / RW262) TaxID=755732 RepID=F2IG83_FLUTR|nr:hypothetical protein Fluta_2737 [Fluviicola taffensis DSM 16823]